MNRTVRTTPVKLRFLGLTVILCLGGCGERPVPALTPTMGPTPTLAPTAAPGSAEDQQAVKEIVRQFGEAVAGGDTLVALLVLSPSAQRVVGSSNLNSFLGRNERPRSLTAQNVHVERDVAIVNCAVDYAAGTQQLQLRLVRIDGSWKIDSHND